MLQSELVVRSFSVKEAKNTIPWKSIIEGEKIVETFY